MPILLLASSFIWGMSNEKFVKIDEFDGATLKEDVFEDWVKVRDEEDKLKEAA